MGVALGLDVGERRIGVARSDPSGLLATPLTTVVRTSDRAAVAAIRALVQENGVELLVVGWPDTEAGTPSVQAQRVDAFARKLRVIPGVRVVFWSERFSTATAGEQLREAGHRPRGRRGRTREAARRQLDAAAAAVILQDFLDQQPRSTAPAPPAPRAAPPLEPERRL
jgi:putative Holliday junction resolvase